MNRRTVIKNLALVVGGTVLLPSCLKSDQPIAKLRHITLSGDQQALIADICETIIPKTTTPGAKDLNLPQFVLKMVDDCYTKKDQASFITGLGQFTDAVNKKYNKPFGDLTPEEREEFLLALEKANKPAPEAQKSIKPVGEAGKSLDVVKKKPDVPPLTLFYSAVKQQTIFGYTNSQYFMTKQIVYELVPGRYNAHFPANKA